MRVARTLAAVAPAAGVAAAPAAAVRTAVADGGG